MATSFYMSNVAKNNYHRFQDLILYLRQKSMFAKLNVKISTCLDKSVDLIVILMR